jgi:dethiobiotin synthetase
MTRISPGCFVTGTDTGVGKTVVACALLRGLRGLGRDVGGMKPIETGVGPAGPLDALALRAAAGNVDPLEDVCPQQFALPAAPSVAAAAEGRRVDLSAIEAAFGRLAQRHDGLVVEGAGGLLVPAAGAMTMADLAAHFALPLVVVARAALGTINHTRLTLAYAHLRGLRVIGVVVSYSGGPLSAADRANLDALRGDPGAPWLGEIPPFAPGQPADASQLDVSTVLTALGRGGSRGLPAGA